MRMTRPIIGIAANETFDPGSTLYHLPISYTPRGYIEGVQNAGGIPLLLPITDPDYAKTYVSQIDKLVLAGGQDVLPEIYGQAQKTDGNYSKARDDFEQALITETLKQGKPIFAVCRGMQLVNVYFGGTLHQEIGPLSDVEHMQDPIPREEPSHDLLLEKTSSLHTIYGNQGKINSFHHQAVDSLGEELQITGRCSDGMIESIENKKRHILGVQWHPDFAYSHLKQEQLVFDYVVKQL